MQVVLHQISKRDDGLIELLVSFTGEPAQAFLATYDGANPKYKYCSVDELLFMRLSNLAHQRFGNCAVYQMELMGIIAAFETNKELPAFPATLGTTSFCTLKPGELRVWWNKLLILLHRMGLYRPHVWIHPDFRGRVKS